MHPLSIIVCAALSVPTLSVPTLSAQDPVPAEFEAAFAAAIPDAADALWTLVPWRTSLTDALAESKRTGNPVFLYVNDGDVASGRC